LYGFMGFTIVFPALFDENCHFWGCTSFSDLFETVWDPRMATDDCFFSLIQVFGVAKFDPNSGDWENISWSRCCQKKNSTCLVWQALKWLCLKIGGCLFCQFVAALIGKMMIDHWISWGTRSMNSTIWVKLGDLDPKMRRAKYFSEWQEQNSTFHGLLRL
jgi:hypothetical protein